ncbi:coproporphyrinogen III oxidase family protein [Candidatus Aerophobetes bacterium]|nr:coproporphyrinogen III oxidase family protein [Candidatus Aerophobetes bacterium]
MSKDYSLYPGRFFKKSERLRSHHQALSPLFAFYSEEPDFAGHLRHLSLDTSRRRTIYIHIPFCTRNCTFCNLNRIKKLPPEDYYKLIIREIKTYASYQYVSEGVYNAIYFGGGTPTTLSTLGLKKILRTLRSSLTLAPDAEITVETTVFDLTKEKISMFKEEGVNRLSIGVQTFSDKGRRLLGRKGTAQEVIDKITFIRESGFQNVGIDLIYNYPGQSEDELNKDLSNIESLDLAGLSFYSLILHPKSALYRMVNTGKCAPLGDLKQEWNYFNLILDRLLKRGFSFLELTKLVQPNRDSYNYIRIRYENGDTLALGAGGGGRLGDVIYFNSPNLNIYRQQVKSSVGLPKRGFSIDYRYDIAHRLIGKLQFGQLKQVDLDFFKEDSKYLQRLTKDLVIDGLLQTHSAHFSLTRKGIFWGNNIGQEFARVLVRLLAHKTKNKNK